MGNCHVRFLGEGREATLEPYPIQVLVTFLESGKLSPTQLRSLAEQLETLAGIQQGFDELNAGQTRPFADFTQEMQRKYDISS